MYEKCCKNSNGKTSLIILSKSFDKLTNNIVNSTRFETESLLQKFYCIVLFGKPNQKKNPFPTSDTEQK